MNEQEKQAIVGDQGTYEQSAVGSGDPNVPFGTSGRPSNVGPEASEEEAKAKAEAEKIEAEKAGAVEASEEQRPEASSGS